MPCCYLHTRCCEPGEGMWWGIAEEMRQECGVVFITAEKAKAGCQGNECEVNECDLGSKDLFVSSVCWKGGAGRVGAVLS